MSVSVSASWNSSYTRHLQTLLCDVADCRDGLMNRGLELAATSSPEVQMTPNQYVMELEHNRTRLNNKKTS